MHPLTPTNREREREQGPLFIHADATAVPLADSSVALTVTSPFYMAARTYGIGIKMGVENWIDFMLGVVRECVRVTVGPVIINCAGITRDWNYWPGCEGLLYRAWQLGIACRRPCYWNRVGIAGSGGPDWLRADIEYCLCFAREPAQFQTFNLDAIGHTPKYAPGGAMSHRLVSGMRANERRNASGRSRRPDGSYKQGGYTLPELANPGNVIRVKVGGGHMGHPLASENEAPFPEGVPEFFIKGWTRPGDIVFDPFSGSGTTACVAARLGRIGIGADLRMSQCELGARRYATPYAKKSKPKRERVEGDLFAGFAA